MVVLIPITLSDTNYFVYLLCITNSYTLFKAVKEVKEVRLEWMKFTRGTNVIDKKEIIKDLHLRIQ